MYVDSATVLPMSCLPLVKMEIYMEVKSSPHFGDCSEIPFHPRCDLRPVDLFLLIWLISYTVPGQYCCSLLQIAIQPTSSHSLDFRAPQVA